MEGKEKLVASSCDIHAAAVEAIAQGCERVKQLRDLLLPVADNLSELAGGLFEETLRSFSMALSMLQGSRRLQSSCSPAASLVTSPCSGEPENKSLDKTRENPEVGDHKNTSRKRWRTQHSRSTETCIPHYDGHQWRKYGQKDIRGSKYPRTYYKCTFRENQGCQARKTVQQKDDGNPPKYIVTYDGQHSCKPMEDNYPIVVIDSTPTRASTLSCEDNSMGSLEEQSLSPMAAQDENSNGIFSWETADFVTTIPTAGAPELCEAMWNPFSPPSLFDGCLELLNYEFSWIP